MQPVNSPRVSVAMATYNGEAYLKEQLDSILCQLRQTDELVISDDGSTDGTKALLAQTARGDSRVRLLDGPKAGLMKNFEHALLACKGDILFLCDQDDIWHADKLKEVLNRFADTQAILVMHDARIVGSNGEGISPSFFATRSTKTGLLKNIWKNSYIGCCMAFRRELLAAVLPFPESIPMHDQFLGLMAERKGHVELIDKPLLDYRRHGANVSADSHGSFSTMIRQRAAMLRALCSRR